MEIYRLKIGGRTIYAMPFCHRPTVNPNNLVCIEAENTKWSEAALSTCRYNDDANVGICQIKFL